MFSVSHELDATAMKKAATPAHPSEPGKTDGRGARTREGSFQATRLHFGSEGRQVRTQGRRGEPGQGRAWGGTVPPRQRLFCARPSVFYITGKGIGVTHEELGQVQAGRIGGGGEHPKECNMNPGGEPTGGPRIDGKRHTHGRSRGVEPQRARLHAFDKAIGVDRSAAQGAVRIHDERTVPGEQRGRVGPLEQGAIGGARVRARPPRQRHVERVLCRREAQLDEVGCERRHWKWERRNKALTLPACVSKTKTSPTPRRDKGPLTLLPGNGHGAKSAGQDLEPLHREHRQQSDPRMRPRCLRRQATWARHSRCRSTNEIGVDRPGVAGSSHVPGTRRFPGPSIARADGARGWPTRRGGGAAFPE